MNGKANDPGLDVHLPPTKRELHCALHRPLHKSEQFRGGTAPTCFSSSFPHLPFPCVTPPIGPFPKQGMSASLFPVCSHLSGQTLPWEPRSIILHCLLMGHKLCVTQCAQICPPKGLTHIPPHAQPRSLIHTGFFCLICVHTHFLPIYTHYIPLTRAHQLSHVPALCTSCSKENRVSSVFLC